MGWAVHPDGLRQVLHRAAGTGLPLYVTENGIATEDDAERVDYLRTHLAAVAAALTEGVDVRGYLHWSAFDNVEWSEGYRPKFGLVAVDHDDGFARVSKPSSRTRSARWRRAAACRRAGQRRGCSLERRTTSSGWKTTCRCRCPSPASASSSSSWAAVRPAAPAVGGPTTAGQRPPRRTRCRRSRRSPRRPAPAARVRSAPAAHRARSGRWCSRRA
jgi:hypothetical protein